MIRTTAKTNPKPNQILALTTGFLGRWFTEAEQRRFSACLETLVSLLLFNGAKGTAHGYLLLTEDQIGIASIAGFLGQSSAKVRNEWRLYNIMTYISSYFSYLDKLPSVYNGDSFDCSRFYWRKRENIWINNFSYTGIKLIERLLLVVLVPFAMIPASLLCIWQTDGYSVRENLLRCRRTRRRTLW